MKALSMQYRKFISKVTSESIKARALQSSFHVIVSIAVGNLVRLLSNLVLTRLLFPEAFGIVMIVQIFTQAVSMLSDIGINNSIINANNIKEPRFIDTAWTAKVLRGLIIFSLTLIFAWPLSVFYQHEELKILLPLAGLSIFILEFSPTKAIIAERNLQMKRVIYLQLSSQVVNTVFTCTAAYIYPSVYSLVLGGIFSSLFLVYSYRCCLEGRNDRLLYDTPVLKELLGFGKWLLLSSSLGLLANSAHKFALGKLLSHELFGIFAVATVLGQLSSTVIRTLTTKILFPLYSDSIRKKNESSISNYRYVLLLFSTFISLFFISISPTFFETLYDDRYRNAGIISSLIIISGFIQTFASSLSQKLIAEGNSKGFSNTILVRAIFLCFFLVILMPISPMLGALTAVLFSNIAEYLFILKNRRLRKYVSLFKELAIISIFVLFVIVFLLIYKNSMAMVIK